MAVNDVARTGFGAEAETYERVRPSYPVEAVLAIVAEFGIGPTSKVLDLAAGTGKLTRQLLTTDAWVVACEPVDGMRKVLAASTTAPALAAVAEDLPVRDGSLDVITVAQAFHWFEPRRAVEEAARVLRPGGGLALLWNERDDSSAWVAELTRIVHSAAPAPYDESFPYYDLLQAHPGFDVAPWSRFSWAEQMDRSALLDLVRSRSCIAALPEPDRRPVLDAVLELVRDFPDTFELPYVTDVLLARRVA